MKKLALTITGLLCLILMSCENEPIGEENINYNTFEVDSELYLLLERTPGEAAEDPLECIDFNYSFVIFVFKCTLVIGLSNVVHSPSNVNDFI